MGQPLHPAGLVTFTCHLPRDKFCKKYLSDPAGNIVQKAIHIQLRSVWEALALLITLIKKRRSFQRQQLLLGAANCPKRRVVCGNVNLMAMIKRYFGL